MDIINIVKAYPEVDDIFYCEYRLDENEDYKEITVYPNSSIDIVESIYDIVVVQELYTIPAFVYDLSANKGSKIIDLNVFVNEVIDNGITELGVKFKLLETTIAYIGALAYLNNPTNSIYGSDGILHSDLTHNDLVQILNTVVDGFHSITEYRQSKLTAINNAVDEQELDAIVIGDDYV